MSNLRKEINFLERKIFFVEITKDLNRASLLLLCIRSLIILNKKKNLEHILTMTIMMMMVIARSDLVLLICV